MPTCQTTRCEVPTADNRKLLDLWGQVEPELRRLLRAWGWREATADDILQEVYLTALQKLPRDRDFPAARLWLLQVAVNRCRLEYRQRRRWQEALVRWSQRWLGGTTESDLGEQREQQLLVRQCLDQLPPTTRLVLILRYYVELNSTEISKLLDVPDSTVRSQLRKARWQLADKLKASGFEE